MQNNYPEIINEIFNESFGTQKEIDTEIAELIKLSKLNKPTIKELPVPSVLNNIKFTKPKQQASSQLRMPTTDVKEFPKPMKFVPKPMGF